MPFIGQAITAINTAIEAAMTDKRFYSSQLFGLSRLVPQEQGQLPAVVDHNGNGTFAGFDDRYPVVLYHRAISMTDAQVEDIATFGDGLTHHQSIYRMRCVVYADRDRLKMYGENLAGMILSSMRISTRGNSDGLLNITTDTFSCDLDPVRVFTEEYALPQSQFNLPINAAYFAINYNLNIEYNTTCIDYCDTCTN